MTRGTVLVLEDSRTQAQYISKMLDGLGWSSMLSFTHKSLLELACGHGIDVLLLDVYVENGNTISLMPRLRELVPETPIILMSAGGTGGGALAATLNMARQAKADFVLPKPFDPARLKVMLDDCHRMRHGRGNKQHVLVIDDSRTIRKLVADALMHDGYRVSQAQSIEDALDNIDIAHIDLVITDIFMPGMGGIEGINLISRAWPEVAIIAMSGGIEAKVESAHVLRAAGHVGAAALLPKPFSSEDLKAVVEAILEQRMVAA